MGKLQFQLQIGKEEEKRESQEEEMMTMMMKPNQKHSVLQGKYELGRVLGQGTYGRVYYARNLNTGKSVAMKVVPKDKVLKAGMMEQVKREISLMKRVKHPNIVDLHEVLASKSYIYLSMELARGGELFTKLTHSKAGRLHESLARRYFRQLISAVHFCHSRGVYHRDLKPENLLLDEHGNLKITDFGLSTMVSLEDKDMLLRTSCGTPHYVAPEVIRKPPHGGYHGSKSDIWSCGVILFVLLAGFLPFHDDNLIRMYRKAYRGEFCCPAWFSPEARHLVTRMLDPNPSTRITLPQITDSEWYQMYMGEQEDQDNHCSGNHNYYCSTLDDNASENTTTTKSKGEEEEEPNTLNAFHIISMSQGLDLSPLFKDQDTLEYNQFCSKQLCLLLADTPTS